MIKRSLFLLPLTLVAGCAMPGPVQFASWVSDGISFLTTRKSVPDHVISFAVKNDCAAWRAVAGGRLCDEVAVDVLTASSVNGLYAPSTSPGSGILPEDDMQEIADFETSSGGGTEVPNNETTTVSASAKRLIVRQDVNMRNKPAGNSRVLIIIGDGQEVRSIGERRGWRLVEYQAPRQGRSVTGWIDGNYLKMKG